MSYVSTDRSRWLYGAYSLRGLGAGASFSASAKVATDIKTGATVSKTVEDTAKAAGVELPDCSSAAITGNDYIDSTFVKCCEDIKKMSGMSTEDKLKGIGKCVARGAATGGCVAAGVVTFGISTALAPLCGAIAGAVFDRVMGWDTKQWVAAGVAGAACGLVTAGAGTAICAFVAAELVGWISDTLAPVFEAVFDPGAAKRRELAAREAFHSLTKAREEFFRQADTAVRKLWSDAIKSIKDVYSDSLALLPSSYRAQAKKILGFDPVYDGVAKALVQAGARITPLTLRIDEQGHTVADRLRGQRDKGGGYGCEGTAEGCLKDGYSEVCPFSFYDLYLALYYAQGKLTGNTRDRQVAFEKQTLMQMQQIASALLPQYQQAIAVVSTKVASVMVGLKQQALLESAKQASRSTLAVRAVAAASRAEAAAHAAGKGFAKDRAADVMRALQQYDIAKTACGALLSTYGEPAAQKAACAKDADCLKAVSGMQRAAAAAQLAAKNSANTGMMHAAVGIGAVATAAYFLFVRK